MNELKIWRYMDLAKFISLLSNKALFFASPCQFNDPYEFDLPKSHYQALDELNDNWKQKLLQELEEKIPNLKNTPQYEKIIQNINQMSSTKSLNNEVKKKFGVSCWHINDYENEALWKVYSNQGQGIAIETTDEKLKKSFITEKNVLCDKVRYEDFDTAPIEKGHKHYGGFLKRKAFEYEKEYRGMVLLDESDYDCGCLIQVNLETLIEKIHIAPSMPSYFKDAITFLCNQDLAFLQDRIIYSNLYEKEL